ncbi:mitogen-activated protein kinase kinase STE7 PWA37_001700 [Arxiozyma heterogenica]
MDIYVQTIECSSNSATAMSSSLDNITSINNVKTKKKLFQNNSLQRKNLKHLILSSSNNQKNGINQNLSNLPSIISQNEPLVKTNTITTIDNNNIPNLENNMKSLSINNNTKNTTINNIPQQIEKFQSMSLRRKFNHRLDNTARKSNSNSLQISASSIPFISSPTSSSSYISSSPDSNISSSPLKNSFTSPTKTVITSNTKWNYNNSNNKIIANNNTSSIPKLSGDKNFHHIQKITVTTSTEEVICKEECIYQLQDMVRLGKIGEGNSGTVTKVLHVPTSKILCKKTIPIDKNNEIVTKQLISELYIMKAIRKHPNIIGFYGALINHSINDDLVILMEYMDCGSLDKILSVYKSFKNRKMTHANKTWFNNPMVISKISYAVLTGLAYLYDNYKIIHRDIKPSNILVNCQGEVKICDFGVSKQIVNSIANTFVGTSTYMSPERIQGNVYSAKGDVWSLGLVIIELVTGEFPLGGHNDTPDGILDLLQRIVNESAPCLPINDPNYNFPPDMIDFVSKCCIKDAKQRPSIKEMLSHIFVLKYNDNASEYSKDFNLWCKKVKSKIRKDRQIRKEVIERAKLEAKKTSNINS